MHKHIILKSKIQEAVASVLPITLLVAAICFTVAPVSVDLMLSFLLGAVLLVFGMGLFTLGAETAMTPIGSHIGARMTKTRSLWFILPVSFVLGVAITVSEPDLQVLAANVPHIDTKVLVLVVAVGVGLFLLVSMLRILLGAQLRWLLLGFYVLVFALAAFSDPDYLSVAFDAGGVTTGPMTVPFIMALGVGVAATRSDRNAESDSFGLVALCSIGPILAVMLLGMLYQGGSGEAAFSVPNAYADTAQLGAIYFASFPLYFMEVAVALAPIVAIFLLFQLFLLHMQRQPFLRVLAGIAYTYVGLVLFLTGVNVGFSPLGYLLGAQLANGWTRLLLIPIAMLMGWFSIAAEPAVHVLTKQVEEVSSGSISSGAMRLSLSIAVALAIGLAMVRVLTGLPILWFLLPGYAVALALSFFVPPIFTAIAFDSGGVASGPMAATFLLPFAMGVSSAVPGGNLLTDAFGLVALVAMMPLITVQIMGAVYGVKSRRAHALLQAATPGNLEIIELWEVESCS